MMLKLKDTNFIKNKNPTLKKDIEINRTVVSNKFPFGKQDFRYLIDYKHQIKKLDPYAYSFQK